MFSNRQGVNIYITDESNGGHLVFPIAAKPLEKVMLTLLDFRFDNLLNNITVKNHRLNITHASQGIMDILIPIKHYSATALKDQLNKLLNPHVVVTYADYKYSFVSTHSFFINQATTCRKILGMGETFPLNSNLYPAHTLVLPKRANLLASSFITIHIPEIHVNLISPAEPPDTTYARVPVNSVYGETIYYRPSNKYSFLLKKHNLSILTLILRDDLGNQLTDAFSCNLGVEYVYVPPDQEISDDAITDGLRFTHTDGNIRLKPFQGSGGFQIG